MDELLYSCPITKKGIDVPLPNGSDDAAVLARDWNKAIEVSCPHCGGIHHPKLRDIYVSRVISKSALNETDEIEAFAARMVGRAQD